MESTKTSTIVRPLPCQLSENEVRLRGIDLANAAKEHIELQDEKKEAAKQFKEKIDATNALISTLKDAVRNAVEVRDVEVEVRKDHYLGKITFIRKDTGDVIEQRMMTPGEMQGEFDLGEN